MCNANPYVDRQDDVPSPPDGIHPARAAALRIARGGATQADWDLVIATPCICLYCLARAKDGAQ